MMDDCIIISDDEDVEVIDQFITCEPILIDLTESPIKNGPSSPIKPESPARPTSPLSSATLHPSHPSPPPPPPPERTQTFSPKPPPQESRVSPPKDPAPPSQPNHQLEPHNSSPLVPQYAPQFEPLKQQQHPPQPHFRPPISDRDLMLAKKEQGNKRYRVNQLNEAVKLYREASEIAQKIDDKEMLAILHFNLAMTYSRLGSYNQAADECAAAVKIDAKYMKAHCKRAEIYMSQGKFDEAVICYEFICEIDSSMKDEAMKRIHHAREMSKRKRKLDQYEVLGLASNFTINDLRKVYRKKARDHHPDRHSDADVVTRRIHEKIFKEASEAYAFFQKRFGFH